MRAGFSSRETLIFITLFSLLLSLIGVLTTVLAVPDWLQLMVFIALFVAYKQSLAHVWKLVSLYRKGKAYKRLAQIKNNAKRKRKSGDAAF